MTSKRVISYEGEFHSKEHYIGDFLNFILMPVLQEECVKSIVRQSPLRCRYVRFVIGTIAKLTKKKLLMNDNEKSRTCIAGHGPLEF